MARLSKEPLFASNNEAALNMFTCRQGIYPTQDKIQAVTNYRSPSHETMKAFLDHFDEKYGGAEQYLERYVGFTQEEISQIKNNILIPRPPRL